MKQTIEYRKSLLTGINASEKCLPEISAVASREEILSFLQENQSNPNCYKTNEDFSNVKQKLFQANFHVHTTNSDGLMTVREELDMAAEYANFLCRNKGEGKKFFVGISDHNTTQGTVEAIHCILNNSEKYKNLKVALGIEASAMFTSQNTGIRQEVHLLSFGLNPFEDTIAQKNEQRLQIFQNGIKKALDNANMYSRDILEKYKINFNFEDFAKIRPSIKTCPSNVRYSLKDYLQFRVLFAQTVENNPDIQHILAYSNIKTKDLDFSEPKRRIINGNLRPYWLNYVKQTAIYLSEQLTKKGKQIPEAHILENIENRAQSTTAIMNKFEYLALDPQSPSYIQEPMPLEFSDVMQSFSSSKYAISGIAHGALYAQNQSGRNVFLQDLFREFKKQMGNVPVFAEKYYPYAPNIDTHIVEGMINLYNYIPSGGLDSHKNNIFTPQQSLSKSFIKGLIESHNLPQNIFNFTQNTRV